MIHRSDSIAPRPRILVVETYPSGCATICASLAELGYEVIGVTSAAAAHAVMALFLIDLVVADVDDRAICALVCELRARGSPVPSVRLTTDAAHHACVAPGVRLLEKPTHLATLAEAIDSTLTA